jgi:ribosomal protein S8
MTTDTIADMLTRIRNANLAKHQIVQIPSTKVTRNIADVLLKEGFIESFEELKNGLRSSLLLSLKYSGKERTPLITKITRASKPGLRVYSSSKKNAKNSWWIWYSDSVNFKRLNDRQASSRRRRWWRATMLYLVNKFHKKRCLESVNNS